MKWGRYFEHARAGFSAVVDAIVPPRERTERTKHRSMQNVPLKVCSHALLNERITTVMDYKDPIVQDLIRSVKYDKARYSAHLCAEILAEYLLEEIATIRAFSTKEVVLVPIPLHATREKERGYNQIALVLQELPQEFRDGTNSKVSNHILVRTRATPPQTRLPRRERIDNVADAFAINGTIDLKRTHVFLIDDVTTTGATLVAAGKRLKHAGAEITLLALARA
jgi:ComF family protein